MKKDIYPEKTDLFGSHRISEGYSNVLIPAGIVSDSFSPEGFTMADTSLATKKDGIPPLVGIRNGDTVTPVPVSYVNGAGYVHYMAQTTGEYVLCYPEMNAETDGDFVAIRGMMTEEALSAKAVTQGMVREALRNSLTDPRILDQAMGTVDADKIASATDISEAIYTYLTALGVDVYVDPDYCTAPNADKAIRVAMGSGIITDITVPSLTGKELAGVLTRLVKAMLGQPVLPSAIRRGTIQIGGWSGIMSWGITDEDFRIMADCGFNMLVSRKDIDHLDHRAQILHSGRKYGVQTLFNDYEPWDYDPSHPSAFPPAAYEYYDFDSYGGNHVLDEPNRGFFDKMAHLANRYHAALPGKLCFYNLLPMYASAVQLMGAEAVDEGDSHPALYQKHVEAYAQTVPGDYMCVDIYPFNMDDQDRKVVGYGGYLMNMDIFATACRKYGRDFWLYIQSYNHGAQGNWRADERDFSLQMYVGLSFGVNTFIYFTYGSYHDTDALIDKSGKPTALYGDAQKINRAIMALSDDFMQYKNLGAFSMNCEKPAYRYACFRNQYTEFDILKEVNSDAPLLFGCCEKKDGEGYAFSVVNLVHGTDRDLSENAFLTFTLKGEHTVHAWIKGEKMELTPKKGTYSLHLDVAEGVFVTID